MRCSSSLQLNENADQNDNNDNNNIKLIMQKMTKKNLAIRLHKSKGHNLGQDTIHN